MAERHVRVFAELTIPTEVDLVLYDDDNVADVMDAVLQEGIKQYIKDYDPDMRNAPVQFEIKRVEKKGEF